MKNTTLLIPSLALGLVLSVAAAGPAARAPIGAFTAVRLAKPPTLDGKLAPGEWDGVFTTSGLMAAFEQQLMTTDTAFSLGWDATNLYFLARCKLGAREWRLTKGVRFNDDYDFGDPSVEFWIAPPKRVPETYQNILNTYPAVMDNLQIPSRGYTGAGWRGNWTIGVSEDADGYTIEASIPITDFGMEGIKDGDVWRFLLARTCQGATPRAQGSWSITQGFTEIPQYPPVTFREDDVAVRLEDVHTLCGDRYRIPLTLVAPRGAAAKVDVQLRWQAGPVSDATDVVETRAVALPAGGREALIFEGEPPAAFTTEVSEQRIVEGKSQSVKVPRRKGLLTVTVTRSGGAALFTQSFPYVASGWVWARPARPVDAPADKPLAASIKYGPETHAIVLRADIFGSSDRAKVAGARARVLDPAAGDKELMAATLPPFREWYSDAVLKLTGVDAPLWDHTQDDAVAAQVKAAANANSEAKKAVEEAAKLYEQQRKRWNDLKAKDPAKAGAEPQPPAPFVKQPVPELPKGPAPRVVVVEVEALDAAGAVLAADRQEVKLLRHKFSWQGNDAGLTDKVIPPWTPVKAGKDGFAVWNRTLALDGLGVAKTVANGGVQQITSMRLVAVVNGKEVPVEAGQPKLGKSAEAWAEFSGTGEAAGLKLSAANRLEFDGYLLSDLTIAPKDAAGVKLDELFWELVLPEAEATHFCATAGGWSAVHDALPERWTSQQTGSGMIAGDFVPYIWLNNGDRAFLWFADNDKGWITETARQVPTQEIVRRDGRVILKVRFIDTPTELKAPTTLRYGWMTFPSRPLPAGSRAVICGQSKSDYPSARYTHFWFDGDWAVLWPYYCSPFAWSFEKSKGMFDENLRRTGPDHRPMVGSIAHSIGRYQDYEGRQFQEFAVDWGEMPGQVGNSDVTQSQGPIDFRLHHYRRWVREAGFKGLYIDENYLSFDRNPLTGGAYVRPDGRVQPGYTYTGLREYFKRMMIMFNQEGMARPNLWQHTTGGVAYHAWYGDVLMEGENVEPTDAEWDYIEVLPAGRMIAIGSPTCNGATTIMMCQAQRHPTVLVEKHIHQFVGWVMAHDILPEGVRWYGPLAQAGRLHADAVAFTGYWKAGSPVRTATPDCVVSMHRTDGRALLWIVNTARQDRQAEVRVDWKALGLDRAKTVAVNAETGAELALTATGFALPVLQRDFASVLLAERRTLAPGQSFAASFEKGLDADDALGCEVLAGSSKRVALPGGHALSLTNGEVRLWGHLNLRDAEGRLAFRGLVGDQKGGSLLRTEATVPRGATLKAQPLVVEYQRGKEGEQVVMRLEGGQAKDAPPPPMVRTPLALAPGWHAFDLSWKDGQLALTVDGQPAGTLAVPSLNLSPGLGPEILGRARFVWGGNRSLLTALDDVQAWRNP